MSELEEVGHLESKDVDRTSGKINTENLRVGGYSGNKPILCMVYGSYCGFCKKAAPAFKSVHDSHKQRKVFLCAIQTDSTDEGGKDLMTYFPNVLRSRGIKFDGVPCYLLYKNGSWSEYKGGRDAESLQSFIDSL